MALQKVDPKLEKVIEKVINDYLDVLPSGRVASMQAVLNGKWREDPALKGLDPQIINTLANVISHAGNDYHTYSEATHHLAKNMLVETDAYNEADGKSAKRRIGDVIEDNLNLLHGNVLEFSAWFKEKLENATLAGKGMVMEVENKSKIAYHKGYMAIDGIFRRMSIKASQIKERAVSGILGTFQNITPKFIAKDHVNAIVTKKYAESTMQDLDVAISAASGDTLNALISLRAGLSADMDTKSKNNLIKFTNICLNDFNQGKKELDIKKVANELKNFNKLHSQLTKSEQKALDYAKRKSELEDKFQKEVMAPIKQRRSTFDALRKAARVVQAARRGILNLWFKNGCLERAKKRGERDGVPWQQHYKSIVDKVISRVTKQHALESASARELEVFQNSQGEIMQAIAPEMNKNAETSGGALRDPKLSKEYPYMPGVDHWSQTYKPTGSMETVADSLYQNADTSGGAFIDPDAKYTGQPQSKYKSGKEVDYEAEELQRNSAEAKKLHEGMQNLRDEIDVHTYNQNHQQGSSMQNLGSMFNKTKAKTSGGAGRVAREGKNSNLLKPTNQGKGMGEA